MKRLAAGGLAFILSLMCLCACGANGFSKNDVVFAGLVLDVKLYGGNGEKAYEEMVSLATAVNAAVSISEPDSDLTRFNAAAENEKVSVSRIVYDLVKVAKTAYEETNGAFNPCLPDVSKAWGVDNEGIKSGCAPDAFPSDAELENLREIVSPDLVETSEENGIYYLTKRKSGVKLDLGGIAKGYLADEFAAIAKRYNVKSGCISLSGNVVLIGEREGGNNNGAWGVGVTDPREKNAYVCGFYVRGDVSAVTSGDYERYYESGGVRFCHVIDPFSLSPVGVKKTDNGYAQKTDYVISATVVGESSAKCDALSTAVMVLGAQEGAKLIEKVGYKGLIFTADKKMKVVGDFDFALSQTAYAEYERI